MKNYQIITDEKALKDFIDWLPDLEPHEKYYCCLFARSKYCKDVKHISSDKAQLKRFTSNKAMLLDKIKQLEVPLGVYKAKGLIAPQESIALYITPNPRNMRKASVELMTKLAHNIANQIPEPNPHQEALSCIQRNKSRSCFVDFDIDSKPEFTGESLVDKMKSLQHVENLKRVVIKYIGVKAKFKILETRGGYHILVEPSTVEKQYIKTWYQNLSKLLPNVDQIGDQMIPVPGTYQGGFTPKLH